MRPGRASKLGIPDVIQVWMSVSGVVPAVRPRVFRVPPPSFPLMSRRTLQQSFAFDAVDGSSTGTRVPWMWVLLRLPRFGGAAGLQKPFGALIAAELLKF